MSYEPKHFSETDHLGSIIGLLNADGTYAERYSFDACLARHSLAKAGGRRRNPTDWSYNNIPAPTILDRGYTGHEHLDVFGLIKMLSGAKSRERSDSGNGRMYDPVLGRFLGADPVLQDQGNSQSFNGYSYCLNNPMRYSDPTGYNVYRDPWTDPIKILTLIILISLTC